MDVGQIAIPVSAYSAVFGGIWFVCKRTDSLLSTTGKKMIASWLRSSRFEEFGQAPTQFFSILYTAFFGETLRSFVVRATISSTIWSFLLFSFLYTNVSPPYFIKFTSVAAVVEHGYAIVPPAAFVIPVAINFLFTCAAFAIT